MFWVVVFWVTMATVPRQAFCIHFKEAWSWLLDRCASAVDCSVRFEHTAHTRSPSDRGGEVRVDYSSLFSQNQSDRTGSFPPDSLPPSLPAEKTPSWSSSSADSCSFTAYVRKRIAAILEKKKNSASYSSYHIFCKCFMSMTIFARGFSFQLMILDQARWIICTIQLNCA